MKAILLSLSLFSFGATAADSQFLVSYQFAESGIAFDKVDTANVYTATVDTKGRLTVSVQKYGDLKDGLEPVDHVFSLSAPVLDELEIRVHSTSSNEIVSTTSQFVCEIAVSPLNYFDNLVSARGYSWKTGRYEQEPALVQGPQGCWVVERTDLKDIYARSEALQLKAMLKVLALEKLNQK